MTAFSTFFESGSHDDDGPDIYNRLDSDAENRYYLFMKAQPQYITDGKGKKKAVIIDIKEYERLIHALEELEDKKAFLSVVHEKSIPYGEIEARLKKSKRR